MLSFIAFTYRFHCLIYSFSYCRCLLPKSTRPACRKLPMSGTEKGKPPKPKPRQCAGCKQFVPSDDPHMRCILCRVCTEANPCKFEADWTREKWAKFLAKRVKRIQILKDKLEGEGVKARRSTDPPSEGKTMASKRSKMSVSDLIALAGGEKSNSKGETRGSVEPPGMEPCTETNSVPEQGPSHSQEVFVVSESPDDRGIAVVSEPRPSTSPGSTTERPASPPPGFSGPPDPAVASLNNILSLLSAPGMTDRFSQHLASLSGSAPHSQVHSSPGTSEGKANPNGADEEEEDDDSDVDYDPDYDPDGYYDEEDDISSNADSGKNSNYSYTSTAPPPSNMLVRPPARNTSSSVGPVSAAAAASPSAPLRTVASSVPSPRTRGTARRTVPAASASGPLQSTSSLVPPSFTAPRSVSQPLPSTSAAQTGPWSPGYCIPRRPSFAALGPPLQCRPSTVDVNSDVIHGWPIESFQGSNFTPSSDDFVGVATDGGPLFYPVQLRPAPTPAFPDADGRVLASDFAPAFWHRVLSESGFPVEYPPQASVPSQSLGVLDRVSRYQGADVPIIPLADATRNSLLDLHKSGKFDRVGWLQRLLPCNEGDEIFFDTPLCPQAFYDRMEGDKSSRCTPLPPTPKGVESSGPPRQGGRPFTVRPWDRNRDDDLRKLESLARDGLRASNAQLIVLAHLTNSLSGVGQPITREELDTSVAFLRELSHLAIDHTAKVVEQSVASRRRVAADAVNLVDPAVLLKAPIGRDLFGGAWPKVAEDDSATRKRKAESAQLCSQHQAKRGRRGRGSKSFRSGRGGRRRGQAAFAPVPAMQALMPQQLVQQPQQPVYQGPGAYLNQAPAAGSRPSRRRGRGSGRWPRAARGARRGAATAASFGAGAPVAGQFYQPPAYQQQQHF